MRKRLWWDLLKINEDGWSSEYKSVDRLLKHLARKSKSESSRITYCYIFSKFFLTAKKSSQELGEVEKLLMDLNTHCKRLEQYRAHQTAVLSKFKINLTPDQFVELVKVQPDEAAELVQAFADSYFNRGSVRYANDVIMKFKTFLSINKTELDLSGYSSPSRSREMPEYVPTLLEALKMADVARCLRDRLAILLLTYTGLRNSTLRALAYNETYPKDPLLQNFTIKKELERNEECVILIIHEVMKKRIPAACKGRLFYYTFLPPRVTECLCLHITEMMRKRGSDNFIDLIFSTENKRLTIDERNRTPISQSALEKIVKNAALRAGLENWKYVYPHCLRKTNESFMRNQPDELKLDDKEREFFFGHLLSGSQDTYFDKSKIEEMRGKFARLNFEPSVSFEKEERVIPEEELPAYLQGEWHFIAALSSGKVVVFRKALKKKAECNDAKEGMDKDQNQSNDADKPVKDKKASVR